MTRRAFTCCLAPAMLARSGPDLSALPNFCSHEHWGSIDSIGRYPGGYRADAEQGATPRGKTGILDLLLEPYLRGLLLSSGAEAGDFAQVRKLLRPLRFNGIYQCTRRGVLSLYGADLSDLDEASAQKLNEAIDSRYRNPFSWYATAMKQAHFIGLIRPVHPEYYVQQESAESARSEARITHTVMRIDPFLDYWSGPPERRKSLTSYSGVEPSDAASWRKLLEYWFDAAARSGSLGIKQLQAYRRDLDFTFRASDDVKWVRPSTPAEVRVLQDWIVNECCRQAHERGWVHQVHVGTNNLPQSSPLPLASLARRYSKMKIMMIHCWPFLDEAGALARQFANVYIDTCWQPVLNPVFLEKALTQWWNYVPLDKITCGHDATTVEMAVGSSIFTREILSRVIGAQASQFGFPEKDLVQSAADLLHGNAERIYGCCAARKASATA